MEHYDLRSCYLPSLSGLHLRIYQFQALLSRHLPDLASHLESLKIEPLYVSQWFLSFFAVTCPLPMLLRIYDVILAEGATETLMRVALSLMQRNQKKLLAFSEFEDAMQFLLSRSLWDTFAQHADALVTDFVSLTGLVSRESLQSLETSFQQSQNLSAPYSLKSAASSLLGRFWAGSSHAASKSATLSLTIPASKPVRKTSSGLSLAPTLNSVEGRLSITSTLATDCSDDSLPKTETFPVVVAETSVLIQQNDRELHRQIEELLTALSQLQHQHIELARDLQQEREERTEEQEVGRSLVKLLQKQAASIKEMVGDENEDENRDGDDEDNELLEKAAAHFVTHSKRTSIVQSKHQLRDAAAEWKERHDAEASKCQDLTRRLDEREVEHNALKEQLRDARTRIQDAHREKQRLERTVQELRVRNGSLPESPSDVYTPVTEIGELRLSSGKPGLREFKLGRVDQNRSSTPPSFSKRSSSLNTQGILATDNQQPVPAEALLLELVNAKTAEAVARQELEETKGKLDALRKILTGSASSPSTRNSAGESPIGSTGRPLSRDTSKPMEASKASSTHAPSASTGGFFSGWGKRAG